jgi:hypothetical protein
MRLFKEIKMEMSIKTWWLSLCFVIYLTSGTVQASLLGQAGEGSDNKYGPADEPGGGGAAEKILKDHQAVAITVQALQFCCLTKHKVIFILNLYTARLWCFIC